MHKYLWNIHYMPVMLQASHCYPPSFRNQETLFSIVSASPRKAICQLMAYGDSFVIFNWSFRPVPGLRGVLTKINGLLHL
jgi:hypothetical protein